MITGTLTILAIAIFLLFISNRIFNKAKEELDYKVMDTAANIGAVGLILIIILGIYGITLIFKYLP